MEEKEEKRLMVKRCAFCKRVFSTGLLPDDHALWPAFYVALNQALDQHLDRHVTEMCGEFYGV